MAIAQKVAGFSLGQADILRRAMGKKKKSELDKQYEGFAAGMKANGYSDGCVKTLWDILLPFSDYAFNKAHSAAYGVISYWTAYLKANYPAEYMAALLTSVKDDKDKMAIYLAECRRMGIRVLPPCVNSSDANFTPVGKDIRFGMTAVRNVGANVVSSIVATRAEKGEFADFADFLRKVEAVVCNKRTIEALIKGGAFDSLQHTRRGLINVYEPAVDAVLDTKRAEAIGQFDLFGSFGDEPAADSPVDVFAVRVPDGEWDKKVLLQFEREMLGLYVSDHPLFGLEHVLGAAADDSIAERHGRGERRAEVDHARRHPVVGEPPRDQGRRALGQRRARGSRRLDRGDVLPGDLRAGGADDHRGRRRRDQGTHRRPRRHRQADRVRHLDPQHRRRRRPRPGRGDDAADALHAADDRTAQGRARHPPRHDRGAPAADRRPRAARAQVADQFRVQPSAALMGDLKALLGPTAISA